MESQEFFTAVFSAICAKSAQEKCHKVQEIWNRFDTLTFAHDSAILPLGIPTFAHFCKILPPKNVPQGKYLKNDLNMAHLLHSVAHIEFSAIDLALDCAYRFRHLPKSYYFDWIEVANEEVKHFLLLDDLLHKIGFQYGDFGVHTLLFDGMKHCDILLGRIALIPRGMEAVGLDVNPFLCAKVRSCNHAIKDELLDSLNIILHDEIHHVSKGNFWFHYICDKEQIEKEDRAKTYIEILKRHNFTFPKANSKLNTEMRLQAGFSMQELQMLENIAFSSRNPK